MFGERERPTGYWAMTDEEEAYSPGRPLPDDVAETGDLTGALQFDLLLLPRQGRTLRLVVVFSPHGREAAVSVFDQAHQNDGALRTTVAHYAQVPRTATPEMPDSLLTQSVQWGEGLLAATGKSLRCGRRDYQRPGPVHAPGQTGHCLVYPRL